MSSKISLEVVAVSIATMTAGSPAERLVVVPARRLIVAIVSLTSQSKTLAVEMILPYTNAMVVPLPSGLDTLHKPSSKRRMSALQLRMRHGDGAPLIG